MEEVGSEIQREVLRAPAGLGKTQARLVLQTRTDLRWQAPRRVRLPPRPRGPMAAARHRLADLAPERRPRLCRAVDQNLRPLHRGTPACRGHHHGDDGDDPPRPGPHRRRPVPERSGAPVDGAPDRRQRDHRDGPAPLPDPERMADARRSARWIAHRVRRARSRGPSFGRPVRVARRCSPLDAKCRRFSGRLSEVSPFRWSTTSSGSRYRPSSCSITRRCSRT